MNRRTAMQGVALVEALVGLAVLAFGLLGVVGMQSTLRFNADVSRQRAEAVRLAQLKMEDLRAFGALSGAPTGEHDYSKIIAASDSPAPPTGFANTSFTRTVALPAASASAPRMKSVSVTVEWLDRRTDSGGQTQKVQLMTGIAESAPIVAAALALPGDRAGPQRPLGRNAAIPREATDLGNGTSRFAPPGAPSGVNWVFNNATGAVTRLCTGLLASDCTVVDGRLVSGFIRFAPLAAEPTNLEAESPTGVATTYPLIDVNVSLTVPVSPSFTPVCYVGSATYERPYFCVMPVNPAGRWSGRTTLAGGDSFRVASDLDDDHRTRYKVCRYTPTDTHTPSGGNPAHPLNYTLVDTALTNQNFFVHSAGDGSRPFRCPDDGPNPRIQSNTYFHQPLT